VFFSCKGLSPSGYLTDVSEDEISMRSAMLQQSQHSYFLCDSSKVGVGCTFTLCHADEVTAILCDADLPEYKKA